jgi:hypothetical protein
MVGFGFDASENPDHTATAQPKQQNKDSTARFFTATVDMAKAKPNL